MSPNHSPSTVAEVASRVRSAIRDVPDFPKAGIVFKDITPVLANAAMFADACAALAAPFRDDRISHVFAIESRGFILGGPVAIALGAGLVPIRKAGKLPYRTAREEYALEYGTDTLEVHVDACPSAARVLIVDDVLATGGTAAAACRLARGLGVEVVGCSFLLELSFLEGGERLAGTRFESVISY